MTEIRKRSQVKAEQKASAEERTPLFEQTRPENTPDVLGPWLRSKGFTCEDKDLEPLSLLERATVLAWLKAGCLGDVPDEVILWKGEPHRPATVLTADSVSEIVEGLRLRGYPHVTLVLAASWSPARRKEAAEFIMGGVKPAWLAEVVAREVVKEFVREGKEEAKMSLPPKDPMQELVEESERLGLYDKDFGKKEEKVGGKSEKLFLEPTFTVTKGKELYSPVKFSTFEVGPFSVTASVRRGQTLEQAMGEALQMLDRLADRAFEKAKRDFAARHKALGGERAE